MIAVDTSVWIELLRGTGSPKDHELRELIGADERIGLPAVALTEILQGIQDEATAKIVLEQLGGFPLIELESPGDFVAAASLCRQARRAGVTIRRTLDCLIAAPCVRLGIRSYTTTATSTGSPLARTFGSLSYAAERFGLSLCQRPPCASCDRPAQVCRFPKEKARA